MSINYKRCRYSINIYICDSSLWLINDHWSLIIRYLNIGWMVSGSGLLDTRGIEIIYLWISSLESFHDLRFSYDCIMQWHGWMKRKLRCIHTNAYIIPPRHDPGLHVLLCVTYLSLWYCSQRRRCACPTFLRSVFNVKRRYVCLFVCMYLCMYYTLFVGTLKGRK